MRLGLEARAVMAFDKEGEEAYWDTLAKEPAPQPDEGAQRRIVGSGYNDNEENRDRSGLYAVDSLLKRAK